MPIYEYRCGKCGHCFEQIQGVSEKDPKIVCPRCGDPQTEKGHVYLFLRREQGD